MDSFSFMTPAYSNHPRSRAATAIFLALWLGVGVVWAGTWFAALHLALPAACTSILSVVHVGWWWRQRRAASTPLATLCAGLQPRLAIDHNGGLLTCNQAVLDMFITATDETENLNNNDDAARAAIESFIQDRLLPELDQQGGLANLSDAGNHAAVNVAMGQPSRYCLARVTTGTLPNVYLIELENISHLKALQQRVTRNRDLIETLLRQGTQPVIELDSRLIVRHINAAAVEVLGSHLQQDSGLLLHFGLDAKDRAKLNRAVKTMLKNPRLAAQPIGQLRLGGNESPELGYRMTRLHSQNGKALFALVADAAQPSKVHPDNHTPAHFYEIFHGSPDAIMIMRPEDSLIIDFNAGFTRLLGYEREHAIGLTDIAPKLWHNSLDRESVERQLAEEREVSNFETVLRAYSGKLVHVEISLRYISVDDEVCLLCVGRDITRRLSAEAAREQSEQKFHLVFSKSPDGLIIWREADNTVVDVNEVFVRRSGYRREDFVGFPIGDFLNDEQRQSFQRLGTVLRHEGQVASYTSELNARGGERILCLLSITALELDGEPHFMAVVKDVSKQRATEQKLRLSEQRFRGIFKHAPVGILLLDLEARIVQVNPTAAKMLAYDVAEMNGIHTAQLLPPDQRSRMKVALQALHDNPGDPVRTEQRLVCRNGIEIWVDMNVVLQPRTKDSAAYYILQIADVSDIKRSQQRMEQMAFYDTLTNLANRRLFRDRLKQRIEACIRHRQSAALIYLDLDNFKRVNDTLGHQSGDQLLKQVATRLQSCVRAEDTVGRQGGDEFNILLTQVGSPSDAALVAAKILNTLRQPIAIDGHQLVVTTSIGITLFPNESMDPDTIMSNADMAMYRAKERGRNNYQFYSDDLNTNAERRLRTEYEIRQALEEDQFELFFQPKVCLREQRLMGVEALIRWNHPQRGLIGPGEFIEVAEETGSIVDIGAWVIEAAAQASHRFAQRCPQPVQVGINLSPRQFRDPNLLTTVRRCIREQRLDPSLLEIEITETMLMRDVDAALNILLNLSEIGVRLAMDDFGTGYSSLSYLRRFPIDTVKIDRSFITELPQNQDDRAITRAVIAMAHQLNMEVVAEGIETVEQLKFLTDERCEFAQGYLFGKAMALDNAIELFNNQHRLAGVWQAQGDTTAEPAAGTS